MTCEQQIGRHQQPYDLLVDFFADVGLAFERDRILEACALGDYDRCVGDAAVIVLACIHAATQFVMTGTEKGVEFGFSNRHGPLLLNARVVVERY